MRVCSMPHSFIKAGVYAHAGKPLIRHGIAKEYRLGAYNNL